MGTLSAIASRPAKGAPMVSHLAATIDQHRGITADFGRRPGRAQVTVLSEEAWAAACAELGLAIAWTARRANLLVAGIPLQPLVGSRIIVGTVILQVTGETVPCSRMDEERAGLRRVLARNARGGVRCRVLSSGRIAVGDPLAWEPAIADLFAPPGERP